MSGEDAGYHLSEVCNMDGGVKNLLNNYILSQELKNGTELYIRCERCDEEYAVVAFCTDCIYMLYM